MRIPMLAVAAAVVLFSAPALASRCPGDIAKIDQALAAVSDLSLDDYNQIMDFRFEGEARHKAGEHGEAVATLAQALDILKADKGPPVYYY